MRAKKLFRQSELQSLIDYNPFLTDQELADKFAVSIQTIRLDRMELGIPELRERVKMVANDAYSKTKTLGEEEIIGDLREFEPGFRGMSVLDVTMEMVHPQAMTVGTEHIFAQANSLAGFVADFPDYQRIQASIEFVRQVYAGERLICTVLVEDPGKENEIHMDVTTTSSDAVVFFGKFIFRMGRSDI